MLAHDLIPVQLGRFWSRVQTARAFCEPTASAPANLYACPLPPAAHRLHPAASLTLAGAPQADAQSPLWSATVDVIIAARTEAEAYAVAADFSAAFFPRGRTWPLFEAGRESSGGVVGVPDNAQAGDIVWKFIAVNRVTSPTLIFGQGVNGTNAEGYAVVGFTIETLAVEHTLTAEEV